MSVIVQRGHSGPCVAARSSAVTSGWDVWDAPRVAIGECIGGRYRVIDVVGQGGCGTIYEAEHLGLGRRVAIKIPHAGVDEHAQLHQRFLREARVSAMVRHANVLEIHDADALDDATPFLVMELLRGESLSARIARGPVECQEAVSIVLQLLDAVSALAAHNVVHRDVKPANVMLCPQEGGPCLVKLVDFGLAKSMDEDAGTLTLAGTIVGTPDYMAPEQVVGAPVDGRADVYACGVVLYELMTGKNPHSGLDFSAHLARALGTKSFVRRIARAGCPSAVEAVVLKALAREPADRYASAAAMRAALLQAVERRGPAGRLRHAVTAARLPLSLSAALLALAAAQHMGAFGETQSIVDAREPGKPTAAFAEPASPAHGPSSEAQTAAARRPLGLTAQTLDEHKLGTSYAAALRALALGEYNRADASLSEVLRRDPGHGGALRTRVVLALARHDTAAATSALERYLAQYPRATDAEELRSRVMRSEAASATLLPTLTP